MPRTPRIAARHQPPQPRAAIARPRLFDRLDGGAEGQLTLVTGPAGSGKTTLLGTWLSERGRDHPVAWLSVEPSHGRPTRLWGELLSLVSEVSGTAGAALGAAPDTVDEEFLATVAAAADAFSEPVLIILDGMERLHSKEAIESLDLLLRIPQAGLRLLIASRRDPYLPLQRLRLSGGLTELRAHDLAFSAGEAQELFTRAGLTLDEAQVARLHRRTEGWVGGLSLAALSLRDHPDPAEFVERFAGEDRTVADYLVEEVLRQQPPPIRDFMLKTSVVDTLEPELADALTGRNGGAAALALLERSNAFLVAIDERRRQYRYHPLLQELLRSQLRHRMPDAYRLEHRLASRWFAAHELTVPAIKHAIEGADSAAAAELVCEHWLSLVLDGEAELLRGWLDCLAPGVASARAELAVAAAGAAVAVDAIQDAERYLVLADDRSASVPAKRRARYVSSRNAVRMFIARARGDAQAMRAAAQRVLASAEPAGFAGGLCAAAHLHLGVASHWEDLPEDAAARLEEALAMARRERRELIALDCLGELALLEARGGRLRQAADESRAAIGIATDHGWDEHRAVADAHLALAIVHLHRSEQDRAVRHLDRAARAAGPASVGPTPCLIELCRAMALAPEHLGEAIRTARAARQDIGRRQLLSLTEFAAVCEAGLLADAGEAASALEVLDGGDPGPSVALEAAVIRARLMLADGEPSWARRLLCEQLHGHDHPTGSPSARIEALALASLASHLLHDDDEALALLELALAGAQPNRCRRPLLRVGQPLRELLRRRIRAGTSYRALAGELVELLDRDRGAERPSAARALLDPLSDREEAVLRYLPTVMSKAEIASEMFVSVNTVKTHTQSIYRKLGVGTRSDAIRRARQLSLM